MPQQASVNYGEHWITFDFETPFVYNGENILISWENHDGSWASGYGWLEGTNYNPKLISHFWHNDDNYPTLPSTEKSSYQPNIKIGTSPFIFNPGNISACNEYILPTIDGHNLSGNEAYYDNSQANNGSLISGKITSSTKVWIYDYNGNCKDEESFNVTINKVDNSTSVSGSTITANDSLGTYLWVDCDNLFSVIPGQEEQSFEPLSNGNYAVIIENENCRDTSNCITINSVDISEKIENNISVYPNPTSGEIKIDIKNYNGEINTTVYDLSGRIVFRVNSKHFNIGDLSKGIYNLGIEYNKTIRNLKIIKK